MGPNDVVVHCASAQSVTLSALGAEAFWVAVVTIVAVALISGFFFWRSNEKERAEANDRVRTTQGAYEHERRKYENEREGYRKDREKQKAEHEAKMIELVRQGNEYSELMANARAGR